MKQGHVVQWIQLQRPKQRVESAPSGLEEWAGRHPGPVSATLLELPGRLSLGWRR